MNLYQDVETRPPSAILDRAYAPNRSDLFLLRPDKDSLYSELKRISNDLTTLHETRAPSWVSAPNMRGTSSILYSCLLKLIACVYTALHLNVPKKMAEFTGLFLTKCRWCFTTLVAPEIVLYYASSQCLDARRLSKDLCRAQAADESAGRNTSENVDVSAIPNRMNQD